MTLNGEYDDGYLRGASEVINTANYGDLAYEYVSGDTINLGGASDTAYMDASNDTVALTSGASSDYVNIESNLSGENVDGNDLTIYGTDDDISVVGVGDVVDGGGDDVSYDYESWGFAGSKATIDKLLQSGTSAEAQKDLKLGYTQAARAAEAAFQDFQKMASGSGKTAEQFSGQKWSQKVITWSLATSAGKQGVSFNDYISSTYGTAVARAFASWAAVSGVTFEQVSDSAQSDIRLGWADLGTATTGQIGNTATEAHNGSISSVLIQLEDPSETAFQIGANGQLTYAGTNATLEQVLIHEIGHALGLEDNSSMNSIMGYDLTSANQTLNAADITAIQSLYGAPQSSPAPTGAAQLIQAMATATSGSPGASTTTFVPVEATHTQTLAAAH
jgi:predicted Zn-dependent protease